MRIISESLAWRIAHLFKTSSRLKIKLINTLWIQLVDYLLPFTEISFFHMRTNYLYQFDITSSAIQGNCGIVPFLVMMKTQTTLGSKSYRRRWRWIIEISLSGLVLMRLALISESKPTTAPLHCCHMLSYKCDKNWWRKF